MTDEPSTPDDQTVPRQADAPAKASPQQVNMQPIVDAFAPELPKLLQRMIDGAEASSGRVAISAGILAVLLSVLAGIALFTGARDTAEKIVIALVSFLGGTAMFGKGTK